jgi:hypothetical protein
MSVLNNATNLFLAADAGTPTGKQISRSLRFNTPDTTYLSRTPGVAGSLTTWTWAGWVKRATVTGTQMIFAVTLNAANDFEFCFDANALVLLSSSASVFTQLISTTLFRDPNAWYHVVLNWDTTNATSADRIRMYVNGTRLAVSAPANPTIGTTSLVNTVNQHRIGIYTVAFPTGLYGYLADVYFIDGQALDPTSFTETSATTGQLIPKAYTGTYGTQGWYLDFSDNSAATATTLGKDSSGNSNNWTPNNFSVTAGVGNDSFVDTPTSYGTDTGVGGEVRGNYATFNPLTANASVYTLTNGNLDISCITTSAPVALATIAVNSGKWYWEVTLSDSFTYVGAATIDSRSSASFLGEIAGQFMYNPNSPSNSYVDGNIYNYATASAGTSGDVIGVALNFDTNTITFYKNGVSQGAFSSSILGTSTWAPAFKVNATNSAVFNFGQRAFAYTAPSGFKALCDTNLPTPTIIKPSTVMDTVLYTGNGSSQTISGLGFSPDLVWIKSRSTATDHELTDSVRGVTKSLVSNSTAAEATDTGGLTAFNSDGFSLGTDTNYNNNAATYAAWAWDGGTSTVTNTSGSISSQVRANASAGFSVVTYTTPSSGGPWTVGHGLNVAPSLIIVKNRADATQWVTYHVSTGNTGYLSLNSTSAFSTASQAWNSTTPSSTVFTQGNTAFWGANYNYLSYCFAPVSGYSSFGSYTGNGNADGPFVYLGFRPAVVIVKMTSSTGNWTILDSKREGYNVDNDPLFPNLTTAEGTTDLIDIASTGFKVRTTNATFNTSAGTYVYAAWAESPFQYARAR